MHVPHDLSRVRVDAAGLPIHGVVGGRLAWELTPRRCAGPPTGAAFAAALSWSERSRELFEVFPFRHELRYAARLRDGRLEIEVTVHACGEDPVPLAFGFHPYLSPPGAARESWLVELPAMRALELDAQQIPIGSGAGARRAALRAAARASSTTASTRVAAAGPLQCRRRRPADRADVRATAIRVRRCSRRRPGSSSASSR